MRLPSRFEGPELRRVAGALFGQDNALLAINRFLVEQEVAGDLPEQHQRRVDQVDEDRADERADDRATQAHRERVHRSEPGTRGLGGEVRPARSRH